MDITLSEKERDPLAAKAWEDTQRIYDLDYKANRKLPLFDLPFEHCSSCGEKHRCVVSVVDMSATCSACYFKKRLAQLEKEEIDKKLAYRAQQLADFAEI